MGSPLPVEFSIAILLGIQIKSRLDESIVGGVNATRFVVATGDGQNNPMLLDQFSLHVIQRTIQKRAHWFSINQYGATC